jgi:hypothetical protein
LNGGSYLSYQRYSVIPLPVACPGFRLGRLLLRELRLVERRLALEADGEVARL